ARRRTDPRDACQCDGRKNPYTRRFHSRLLASAAGLEGLTEGPLAALRAPPVGNSGAAARVADFARGFVLGLSRLGYGRRNRGGRPRNSRFVRNVSGTGWALPP